MKTKLKSRAGVTLIEMLVAVILLALLTAGGAAAANAVLASRNRMIEAANAEILASTAAEALANEIRLGSDFEVVSVGSGTDNGLKLDSVQFGPDTVLKLDTATDKAYRLVAETAGTTLDVKQILAEKVYSGLYIDELKFTEVEKKDPTVATGIDATRTGYTVTFKVFNSQGVQLWADEVTSAPMGEE